MFSHKVASAPLYRKRKFLPCRIGVSASWRVLQVRNIWADASLYFEEGRFLLGRFEW